MKRLVSFSVAAVLAMGMTAGAVSESPNLQAGNACKPSVSQTTNSERTFQQLRQHYGLSAHKQMAARSNFCMAAKQDTDCPLFYTHVSKPGINKNPNKPVTEDAPTAKPDKPVTEDTPTAKPDKPVTEDVPAVKPDKPVTEDTPTVKPDKPVTEDTPTAKPDKPVTEDAPISQSSFAAQVVSLVNAERAKQGLSALQADSRVTAAAQVRAGEIKSSFAHTRPDGRAFSTALSEAGASYRGAGENIAYGQTSPEAVMNAWMNSPGHRANILNANYKTIGVGYASIGGVAYWTQLFTY